MNGSHFLGVKCLGYQQFTAAVATALPSIPAGTEFCLIICETQAIRWRSDGTNPTATVGAPLAVGSELQYTGGDISRIRIIEQTTSTVVNVTYFGGV